MHKETLEAFAREESKGIKTKQNFHDFRKMMTKVMVGSALNTELDDHLGYDKHETSSNPNNRNDSTSMTSRTENGQFQLDIPRDHEGTFEPKLVKKGQTRFNSMSDKILFLCAQGMTNREMVRTFKELYCADASLVNIQSHRSVIEHVIEWQSRELDAVYPIA